VGDLRRFDRLLAEEKQRLAEEAEKSKKP